MATLDTDIPLADLMARAHVALSQLPPAITELGEVFARAGHEISLVGGPVRDAFLGITPHDFDFTTSAPPETTIALLTEWGATIWETGRDFGTIGGARSGLTVEVTTYRSEAYDPDSRKPDVVYGDSLEGDLTRRDFTVNAIAMRLPQMVLVDPHDGLGDIQRGILRTPVDPVQSFSDDPLRIMRAARFCAQLGFDIDPATVAAMETLAQRLEIVSVERIRTEFERLITAANPRRGIEILVYTGVIEYVIPELALLQQTQDEHQRHKDVYEHSLTVMDQAIARETDADGPVPGPNLVLRLAALLHDIGKPATRRFDERGKVSFYAHDIVGAKIAKRRLRHLRFDNATIKDVCRLIELHMRFYGYGDQQWTDSAIRRYVSDAGDLLEHLHRLTRADCTTRNARIASRREHAYDDLEKRIAKLRESEELAAIRPDLNGGEIMAELGLKPGPEVGQAYKFLLDLRMENGPLGPDLAREKLRQWWENRDQ